MSKRIALVTYSRFPDLTIEDRLLIDPLKNTGYEVIVVPWDKRGVDWEEFDAIILRSCWDYHLRFEEFNAWLDRLEKMKVRAWNPIPLIRWNADKKYLLDLQKKGINVVPSHIIKRGENVNIEEILKKYGWEEVVVKPTIGASAYGVYYTAKDRNSRQILFSEGPAARQPQIVLALRRLADHCGALWGSPPRVTHASSVHNRRDILVQKFIKEIKIEGEWSLVFFGGKYSHAVLLKPHKNDFRVYKGMKAIIERDNPPLSLVKEAEKIIKTIKSPLLYARVDMVISDNKPLLMELELIEPRLFFDEESARRFAAELKLLIL